MIGTAGHLNIHEVLEPDVESLTHNIGKIVSQPTPPLSTRPASSRKLVSWYSTRVPSSATSLATYRIGRTHNQVFLVIDLSWQAPRVPSRATSPATYRIGHTQNQSSGHRLKLARGRTFQSSTSAAGAATPWRSMRPGPRTGQRLWLRCGPISSQLRARGPDEPDGTLG